MTVCGTTSNGFPYLLTNAHMQTKSSGASQEVYILWKGQALPEGWIGDPTCKADDGFSFDVTATSPIKAPVVVLPCWAAELHHNGSLTPPPQKKPWGEENMLERGKKVTWVEIWRISLKGNRRGRRKKNEKWPRGSTERKVTF